MPNGCLGKSPNLDPRVGQKAPTMTGAGCNTSSPAERVMKILVVDDDRLVLGSVAAVLEARGYRVWATESAAVALRLAEEVEPDVVVTDLRMPDMDGLAMLRHLGDRPRAPCRVIYSASPMPEEPERLPEGVVWVTKAPGHVALIEALEQLWECVDGRE